MSAPCILVVDDNPTNLKLICDVLESEDYQVFMAIDAEEAWQIIEHTPPDLLLLDIALPGMDGLTFTRKLRADEKTHDLLIVAVTAFAMKGDEEKAREAGCDGYITKPINTRTLGAQVAAFLENRVQPDRTQSLKVLVVEDTHSDMKLAEHVLIAAGHQVTGAEAAQQALESVKRSRPHVILLDLILPDIDGLALVRALKADPATAAIPIVAVTAFPENFPKATLLEAGCDAYLVKPLDIQTLPGQLEQVVEEQAREGEIQ
jgi:two-component system cell cycle response regulator